MALSKRQSKCVKAIFLLCICCSVLIGLNLLGKAQNNFSPSSLKSNERPVFSGGVRHVNINPRQIMPAFFHKFLPYSNLTKATNMTANNQRLQQDHHGLDMRSTKMELKTKFPVEIHKSFESLEHEKPSYRAHAFYYPWYGTPELDGQYYHWNHPYIRHWDKAVASKWPDYTHKPPDDVGSNFYPLLGAYSSQDAEVIELHMKMMKYARIGVVVVSWYPPGDADNEGREPDSLMPALLDAAEKFDLKVALHIEPFKGRNAVTMKENLKYIVDRYGNHPAFYRTSYKDKINLPLIYIYDSYLNDAKDWAKLFKPDTDDTVRGTELDGIFIGLLVEPKHKDHLIKSGFDGFYTYFATNQFTFGSTWKLWPELKNFSERAGLMFIPSIGPGYIDTEVRPWNGQNTRKRLNGNYYKESFTSALKVRPEIVSITSFNEWHEGTQIEPAIKKKIPSRVYLDYGTNGPNFYLDLTKMWINKFDPLKQT